MCRDVPRPGEQEGLFEAPHEVRVVPDSVGRVRVKE